MEPAAHQTGSLLELPLPEPQSIKPSSALCCLVHRCHRMCRLVLNYNNKTVFTVQRWEYHTNNSTIAYFRAKINSHIFKCMYNISLPHYWFIWINLYFSFQSLTVNVFILPYIAVPPSGHEWGVHCVQQDNKYSKESDKNLFNSPSCS